MPSKIVYNEPGDAKFFDLKRFTSSLRRYGEIDDELINSELEKLSYDPMHVSVLVKVGVRALKDDEAAKKYYNDNEHWFKEPGFERLRRITGYLVGSLENWNDAKRAAEKARVKHGVFVNKSGVYTKSQKAEIELAKAAQPRLCYKV